MMSHYPFFIVGFPRSGTTLLAALLDRHSCISIPPETRFFRTFSPCGKYRKNVELNLDMVLANERISDLNLDRNKIIKRLSGRKFLFEDIFQAILEVYLEKSRKKYVGEKSPVHLLYTEAILKVYPEAKIFCLMRDGRDVVNSLLKAPWAHNSLFRHCAEWNYRAHLAYDFKTYYSDSFNVYKYEDLLTNPEKILKEICNHLGLDFEPSQLIPNKSEVVPSWEKQWKEKASNAIDNARLGAWKKEVKGEDLYLMDQIMMPGLSLWGYMIDPARYELPNIKKRAMMNFFKKDIYYIQRYLENELRWLLCKSRIKPLERPIKASM